MAIVEHKSERIEVRTIPSTKALLQQAAVSSRKTVPEFMLEAGIAAAENTLAEQRIFRSTNSGGKHFRTSSTARSPTSLAWPDCSPRGACWSD